MIQRFLNKHGLGESNAPTPTGSGPGSSQRGPSKNREQQQRDIKIGKPTAAQEKNEEFYLNNCPVELASICVKLLVDVLVQVGKC